LPEATVFYRIVAAGLEALDDEEEEKEEGEKDGENQNLMKRRRWQEQI
jgi:hypothetical protein